MRATAPAVSLRCSGGPLWHTLQWLLPALAAAVFSVWLWAVINPYSISSPVAVGLQALLPGLAVAGILRRVLPRQDVALVWDSQGWQVDGLACTPQVMLDLGPWLLLRCSLAAPQRPKRLWVAVARADVGERADEGADEGAGTHTTWHALRAALFARRPAKAQPTLPT
jgi:hypothetical protein